jgi:hypothetical protein
MGEREAQRDSETENSPVETDEWHTLLLTWLSFMKRDFNNYSRVDVCLPRRGQ